MLVCTVALPPGWEVAFRRRDDLRKVVNARAELLLEAALHAVERAEAMGL
jgi:hypothetical protein